jgi:hypothetical protein
MNTKGLARLYDRLSPRERLPLILAAAARGDEADHARLVQSAPTAVYRVPDYYPLAEGLLRISLWQKARALDLAATFYRALAALDDADQGGEGGETANRIRATVSVLAYFVVTEAEGWRRFCAGLSIDSELLRRGLPGHETAEAAEEAARPIALTVEGVTAWLRRTGGDGPPAVTVEAVAAGWARLLDWHVALWE